MIEAPDWLDLVPGLAMFPLGSPLFPHMPLPLQIFEPRYRQMLVDLLQAKDLRFGVVLIERGHEVGGGEKRFDLGTIAEVTSLDSESGLVRLLALGRTRCRVREWLAEEPYPRAEVEPLDELVWTDDLQPLRSQTEAFVRQILTRASEFDDQMWSADIELADDPVAAAWQLAAIAPVTAMDQLKLLAATSMEQLLSDTERLTRESAAGYL